MISTWCGTPNLSMWSSPAGDRLSTTRKAIWRPAIESIDHGKYPGIPAPAAPSKTANDGRKPDGKNNKDGGTGQIAVKKAVPTVAWPVGPILNKCGPAPATGCTFAHSGAHIGNSALCSLGKVKGGWQFTRWRFKGR